MRHWLVNPHNADTRIDVSLSATEVTRLIGAIGSRNSTVLASAVLELTRKFVDVHHCSILSFEAVRCPRLISAASVFNQWHVFDIATQYSRKHFQKDGIQALLRRFPASFENPSTLVHRQSADELDDADYRADCYDRIGIVDRLAVLTQVGKEQWLSVNLYRDASAGQFTTADLDTMLAIAPLLASAAARHYACDVDGETVFRGTVTDELGGLCPQLTTREREVVLRILDGETTERIADELHIRPTTVITYRTRAYEKLGVSSRRELFAVVLRSAGSHPCSPIPAAEIPHPVAA